MKATIFIIKKVLRFCYRYVIALAFVFLLSSFITLGVNILNKTTVNILINDIRNNHLSITFIFSLAGYLVIWLLSSFIGYIEAFANNIFRLKVDVFMQKLFMKKINETDQELFFDTSFMEKYTFINNNTNRASLFIFKVFTIIFSNIAVIGSSIVIFIIYEPLMILFAAGALVLQSVSTVVITNLQYKLSKKQIKEERIANYLANLFVNKATAKEMRIYNFSNYLLSIWDLNNEKYIKEKIITEDKTDKYNTVTAVINILIRLAAIIILFIGMKQGKYDVGTFIMLYGLSEACKSTLSTLAGNVISGFNEEVKYFKDYYEIVFPVTNNEIKEAQKLIKDHEIDLCLGEFNKLEVKDVSFIYPNSEKLALKNVSLTINKGEIVSILGYNGSGKTTLSKIICGAFTPFKGSVMINGKPINEYPKSSIFKYFGIAPQDYSRFSVSIRDHVGLGYIEKMENTDEIHSAFSKANLYNLINKYENKENTLLGKEYDKNGVELSGGEMQKIILASAYMGNPEILILDEPTASIDPLKEIEMLENFREILSGKTAVLISHRIGFARLADKIIMMRDGEIVEEGSHEQLLEKNGYYAEMFNQQKHLYVTSQKDGERAAI